MAAISAMLLCIHAGSAAGQAGQLAVSAQVPEVLTLREEGETPLADADGRLSSEQTLRVTANIPWRLEVRVSDEAASMAPQIWWRVAAPSSPSGDFLPLGPSNTVVADGAPGRSVPLRIQYRWSEGPAAPQAARSIVRYTLVAY